MPRRRAKVDANQPRIVEVLRGVGCSVQSLAAAGDGVPDLLVGYHGENLLLEVKDGDKPPSHRKLTKDQEKWHAEWRGKVCVVKDENEALDAVGVGAGR